MPLFDIFLFFSSSVALLVVRELDRSAGERLLGEKEVVAAFFLVPTTGRGGNKGEGCGE